jgi:hypothetical protein
MKLELEGDQTDPFRYAEVGAKCNVGWIRK